MHYRKFFTLVFTICFQGISSFGQALNTHAVDTTYTTEMPSGNTIANVTGPDNTPIQDQAAIGHMANTITVSMCSNETYYFGAQPIATKGTYVQTFPTVNNYDSTVTLHLTVNPVVTATVSLTVCPDQLPITWNGITIPAEAMSHPAFATYNTFNAMGCDSTVTLNLTVSPDKCRGALMMPNAFSPNGDGLNDKFGPEANSHPANYVMRIYNRRGQVIYTSYKADQKWDGTSHGQPSEPGTYCYIIAGSYTNGQPFQIKGNVILVR